MQNANAAKAKQFYQELIDSVEALTALGETHGIRTMADLLHMQAAILDGTFIDAWPDSKILDVINGLPSSEQWLMHISEYDDAGHLVRSSPFSENQPAASGPQP